MPSLSYDNVLLGHFYSKMTIQKFFYIKNRISFAETFYFTCWFCNKWLWVWIPSLLIKALIFKKVCLSIDSDLKTAPCQTWRSSWTLNDYTACFPYNTHCHTDRHTHMYTHIRTQRHKTGRLTEILLNNLKSR